MPDTIQYSDLVKRDMKKRYNNFAMAALNKGKAENILKLDNYSISRKYFIFKKLRAALQLANLKKSAHILELGCNTGQFSFFLAEMGYQVTGLDISAQAIEIAQKKVLHHQIKNLHFIEGDIENFSKEFTNKFDAVFSFSTLRYVPNLGLAFAEIYKVLKPNAPMVIDLPNKYCPWFKFLKTKFGVDIHEHDNHYSSRVAMDKMRQAGFKNIKIEKILFTPPILPAFLLPIFKRIDFIAEKTPVLKECAAILMCKGQFI